MSERVRFGPISLSPECVRLIESVGMTDATVAVDIDGLRQGKFTVAQLSGELDYQKGVPMRDRLHWKEYVAAVAEAAKGGPCE